MLVTQINFLTATQYLDTQSMWNNGLSWVLGLLCYLLSGPRYCLTFVGSCARVLQLLQLKNLQSDTEAELLRLCILVYMYSLHPPPPNLPPLLHSYFTCGMPSCLSPCSLQVSGLVASCQSPAYHHMLSVTCASKCETLAGSSSRRLPPWKSKG